MTLLPAEITVAVPSIPPRAEQLQRALRSVAGQMLPAAAVAVAVDHDKQGAAATRQRALDMVRTPWVAFLDDDDEMHTDHLAKLAAHAAATGADYVFSWFVPASGHDPVGHFGKPFNPDSPHHTTITVLVRTDLAQQVGFGHVPVGGEEDWLFTLGCVERGAHISHLPERTWTWHNDGGNTSGRPDRW